MFQAGGCPPICAFTGEPATTTIEISAKSTPNGLIAFVLFCLGFLPCLPYVLIGPPRITGHLPITPHGLAATRVRVRAKRIRAIAGAIAVCVAVGLAVAVWRRDPGALAVVGLIFVAPIVLAAPILLVHDLHGLVARANRRRSTVEVSGVHHAFASAMVATVDPVTGRL